MVTLKDHIELAILLLVLVLAFAGFGIWKGPSWLVPSGFVALLAVLVLDGAYIQWREERGKATHQAQESSTETIDKAIAMLKGGSLLLKYENKEMTPTYAQVFMAISDHLSNGLSLDGYPMFELIESAIEAQDAGDYRWVYPNDGPLHMMARFCEYGITERRVTTYTRESYRVGKQPIIQPPGIQSYSLGGGTFEEAGTDVRYYLTPVGATVARFLREREGLESET